MIKLLKQHQSRLVGIDIRSSSVHLLELSDEQGRIIIQQGAIASLPHIAIADGELSDTLRVGLAIKDVAAKTGMKIKSAALAVCGAAVSSRTITVDESLSESEIESIAWSEVKHNFPDLSEICNIDYHYHQTTLQSVVCRKDRIDRLIEIAACANIVAEVVDVDYYALQRALRLIANQLPTEKSQSVIAIINLDYTSSTFVVIRGENVIYTRSLYQNNTIMLAEARHQLGVEDWILGYAEKAHKNTRLRFDLARLIAPGINAQLRLFLQFYHSIVHDQLDQIILCGECAVIPELARLVEEQQRIPVIVGNPFEQVSFGKNVDREFLEAVAPTFMLCSGLALRKSSHELH